MKQPTPKPAENKLIIDFEKIKKMIVTLGEMQIMLKDIKIIITGDKKK